MWYLCGSSFTVRHRPRHPRHRPSTTLIHQLNDSLCPIVCQGTIPSNTESNNDISFGPGPGYALSQVQIQEATDEPCPKFTNQRLSEELYAPEGVFPSSRAVAGSSSSTVGTGHVATIPLSQPCSSSSSTTAIPIL